MENEDEAEDNTSLSQLSDAGSWHAIHLPKPQRKLQRSMLPPDGVNISDEFKMENCSIDLSPGGSQQSGGLRTVALPEQSVNEEPVLEEILESVSLHSIESFVCRICHNCENPEKLVSPCLCKGSLTYVHIHCLERWISTSRCTSCELCQFQYNTEQTLRYSLFKSLRIWYSRSMSRRALQEDCQLFSLLTLVAFGLIGTLLVAVQYYILQEHVGNMARLWSKGWLIFFLFATLAVYFVNVYMIAKSHLTPWYRWWQSARDIRLILENRKPFPGNQARGQMQRQQQQQHQQLSQHQQAAVDQTSAQMPMDQATKSTSGHPDNDTTCPNTVVQSWPQDTESNTNTTPSSSTIVSFASSTTTTAATTAATVTDARTTANLIFLPINNYSNNTVASHVLAAPYDDCPADDNSCDDVVALLPKYCHKNASLHSSAIGGGKDNVTAIANCQSMLLTSTATSVAKRIFSESAIVTATAIATATASTIAPDFDVPLECGCVRFEYASRAMKAVNH